MAALCLRLRLVLTPTRGLPSVTKRCLLSAAYLDTQKWEQRKVDPQNLAELAALMDQTYEKKLPVSSLTISRFVDNISSREEVDQAEYYLYKFRHSPNCFYVRDWTIHSWIRKCLMYGAREKALHTLKNQVQYGMFPDNFTFNLLMDTFIKEDDYNSSLVVVNEIMLQEAFDEPCTQLLSLYVLHKYLQGKPDLKWEDERNLGAALLLVGLTQDNTVGFSSRLLGHVFLGRVELTKGIRAVYTKMPLMWTRGYLNRALNVMEEVVKATNGAKLCKDAVDAMAMVLEMPTSETSESKITNKLQETKQEDAIDDDDDDDDEINEKTKLPDYLKRFKELHAELQSLGKIETESLMTMTEKLITENLLAAESSEIQKFEKKLEEWEEERAALIQREKEIREKVRLEREARQAAKAKR
ncbi:28S ribosomal protein S27, mitochondrial [Callorhinchus milii]|uniref:28S ribosomal protein S27, mitochondrial n=1 Tax=Callorhinchus milii TaxID=7868 RepID=UPI00045722A4|nr:28S ribosomal protein S27, mitochondrial [Callorhinchus milii]|eukprot:gi/632963618/ref/XP_007897983.1/ PREDICTED: 28S ribosomal protein S27, mitochondrial [Callorhinchus milii]